MFGQNPFQFNPMLGGGQPLQQQGLAVPTPGHQAMRLGPAGPAAAPVPPSGGALPQQAPPQPVPQQQQAPVQQQPPVQQQLQQNWDTTVSRPDMLKMLVEAIRASHKPTKKSLYGGFNPFEDKGTGL